MLLVAGWSDRLVRFEIFNSTHTNPKHFSVLSRVWLKLLNRSIPKQVRMQFKSQTLIQLTLNCINAVYLLRVLSEKNCLSARLQCSWNGISLFWRNWVLNPSDNLRFAIKNSPPWRWIAYAGRRQGQRRARNVSVFVLRYMVKRCIMQGLLKIPKCVY